MPEGAHWNEKIPVERWLLRLYQFIAISEIVTVILRLASALVRHG